MNFVKNKKKWLKILLKLTAVVESEILIFNSPYSYYSSKEFKIKLNVEREYQKEKSNMEKYIKQCLEGKIDKKKAKITINKPKIIVYMLIYNGEKYLNYSLQSIFNQNISEYEFLAVDDNSKDNTLRILQKLKNKD